MSTPVVQIGFGGPPAPLQTQINGFRRFSGAARRPRENFEIISLLLLIFAPSESNLGHNNYSKLNIVNKILVSELENCSAQTAPESKFPGNLPSGSEKIFPEGKNLPSRG